MARATRTGQIAGFRTKGPGVAKVRLAGAKRNGGGSQKSAALTGKQEPTISGSTRRTKT